MSIFLAFWVNVALAAQAATDDANSLSTGNETVDVGLLSLFVGVLLPNIIAIVVQPAWRPQLKGLVTFALCVGAAFCTAALQGEWNDVEDIGTAITAVLLSSQLMYRSLWKPSGIAESIESATSTGP